MLTKQKLAILVTGLTENGAQQKTGFNRKRGSTENGVQQKTGSTGKGVQQETGCNRKRGGTRNGKRVRLKSGRETSRMRDTKSVRSVLLTNREIAFAPRGNKGVNVVTGWKAVRKKDRRRWSSKGTDFFSL